MADEAGPRVSAELRAAAGGKTRPVRVEAGANPLPSVAGHAIPLGVARDAGVQVSLRLVGVVARPSGRVAPLHLGRMKASAVSHAGRRAHRDARAHVAVEAEALLA